MNFLNPSFLWALGALSIPIIIHLFNFRKTTRVLFSNTRFLKQVKESTTAKRKLKHYLILASRLLFLFFLVIAFAQPFIPAKEQLANHRNIVLYLDNSQSMSSQLEDKTRGLDAAVSFVENLLNVFPADTRYRLITNDFAPFSNTFKTKKEIQELLTQIRFSSVSRTMDEVLSKASQQSMQHLEVFYVSDFQQATLGNIAQRDSLMQLHLVPISIDAQPNVFVDSVYLDNPFAAGGEKNVLRVKLRNEGKKDVNQLSIKLTINGVQAGTSGVSVPTGGVSETSFDLVAGLSGLNKTVISFNDFPVSFDNEFYAALNFTQKINVLEVKSNGAVSPVEKVFGNEKMFAHKAYLINNFNYSLLDQADLVVINGLNSVDQGLSMALREYMDNGGTLLLIPGAQPDVKSYQNALQLPRLTLAEQPVMQDIDRPDFANPFFENVFEERAVAMVMPKAKPLIEWGTDRAAILRFKNDKAFLSSFDRAGRVFLMASPLETATTDIFNHALFVPVMYRIAASSKKSDQKVYYTLKENFITLRVDSARNQEQLKFVSKEEIIPSQRKVGDRVFLDIPKFTMSEGFYHVVAGKDTINLLAFNLEKSESLLQQANLDQLRAQLGGGDNVTVFEGGTPQSLGVEIKEKYLGTPLWKYAIMLALFFIVAEVLLIRFLK